jgi:hypothetical protein
VRGVLNNVQSAHCMICLCCEAVNSKCQKMSEFRSAATRLDPTTIWGWCGSNSAWAILTASADSLCGWWVDDGVAVLSEVGRYAASCQPEGRGWSWRDFIPAADLDSSFLTGTPENKIECLLVADL